MLHDSGKMQLSAEAISETKKVCDSVSPEFLHPNQIRDNVVGMGVGVKWRAHQPTGEQALVVLVNRKLPKEQVSQKEIIPPKIGDMQTDVLEVGYPIAGGGYPMYTNSESLTAAKRPVKGGWSVGHPQISAGTIGGCVYDKAAANNESSQFGVNNPFRYYILSNNHVLADSNNARIGDSILQPGPADGGDYPQDAIAVLRDYVPITFEPPTDKSQHRNLVDAAIAEGDFQDLDREIYWVGYLNGWVPISETNVGMLVHKTGRTTNYTTGRITVVNATVDVWYDARKVARFTDQIITTPMSAGGDSGSLVATLDNKAVGLLFAGSESATIVNQIEHVISLLGIEVAPSWAQASLQH